MSKTTALLDRLMWLWVLIIGVSVSQIVIWSLDRSPPFRIESYRIAPVHQGGAIELDAQVWRDARRECSVTLSNNLYDSRGTRYVIEPPVTLPHGAIAALEKKPPGRMIRKFPLPDGVALGPASLVSSMSYICNPLQELFRPISVQEEFAFEVLM